MVRINILRSIGRLGLAAATVAAGIGAAQAAPVVLDLTGRADALNGGVGAIGQFGRYGLFFGQGLSNSNYDTGPIGNGDSRFYNWRWNTVEMTIFENGNANISGAITRLLDEVTGDAPPNGDNRLWNMNIDLTRLVLTGDAWRNGNTGNFDGIIQALEGTGQDDVGLDWTNAALTIVPDSDFVPTGTSIPQDNWVGLSMPNIGHQGVADLHFDQGTGLTFEAWYKHQPLNASYY